MSGLDIEIKAQKFASLLDRVKGMTFSWTTAVHLVGGKKRLERLMLEDKVRYNKPSGAVNTKWQFSARDILDNVKPLPRTKVNLS